MKKTALILLLLILMLSCSRPIESPTVLRDFKTPAISEEVVDFSITAAEKSRHLSFESIGTSVEGKDLVTISASKDVPPDSILRVLIFAQQHGNEQSGKEASMLLIRDLAQGKNLHWLDRMQLWIIPQLNPDGADRNERRNSEGVDLNRDHILQHAPETRALHELFRRIQPHVTIDIHEYQPYRESWREFGGYKNFDVQVGVPTNPNVSENLREFALRQALPAIETHLNEKGFSFHNYLVGPVPTEGRTRHSTVDFDDGRQSFAILNTLSFIYEGINGPDGYVENLQERTYSQVEALTALLDFLHHNAPEAVDKVDKARKKLIQYEPGKEVAIRMEHFPDGRELLLPLTSSHTGNDTIVTVKNYLPRAEPVVSVTQPRAYLVPVADSLLMDFLHLHHINYQKDFDTPGKKVHRYFVENIETSVDEELENRLPSVTRKEKTPGMLAGDYVWVPTSQIHAYFLVSLFEPKSMLGLAQRKGYEYLLEEGNYFPILRVEN